MLGPSLCSTFAIKEVATLAQDHSFKVRRECAVTLVLIRANVGRLMPVGQVALAEECRYNNNDIDQMIELYLDLGRDPVWSVRKSCADCLADFSSKTKAETRSLSTQYTHCWVVRLGSCPQEWGLPDAHV